VTWIFSLILTVSARVCTWVFFVEFSATYVWNACVSYFATTSSL